MDWMMLPLRRYAQFDGRSRRKEYWHFALLYFAVLMVAAAIDYSLGYGSSSTVVGDGTASFNVSTWGPAELVVVLFFFLPSLSVGVRRLHDTDRRGWWLLIGIVPLVGAIVLLVLFCLDGTPAANRFGPDPKAGEPGRPHRAY